MVFQNYALYPHMTVFDNMAFGLKLRKTPKKVIRDKIEEVADILDLGGLLQRKPKALSGGQRQRVALGRAIVREPAAFLLDEPLSNLDAKLRTQMRAEITKLHYRLGATFVYVTHDQTEAMTMGDRLVVMKDGFIQQVDTPQKLYDDPCNLFVAGFIGSPQMNTFEAVVTQRDSGLCVTWDGGELPVPDFHLQNGSLSPYVGKSVIVGIRPESFSLEGECQNLPISGLINARVELSELMGAEVYLHVRCGKNKLIAKLPAHGAARPDVGVRLAVDCERLYLFDRESEKAIRLGI
jgi:multiple sugar transport system ATP-binding protein